MQCRLTYVTSAQVNVNGLYFLFRINLPGQTGRERDCRPQASTSSHRLNQTPRKYKDKGDLTKKNNQNEAGITTTTPNNTATQAPMTLQGFTISDKTRYTESNTFAGQTLTSHQSQRLQSVSYTTAGIACNNHQCERIDTSHDLTRLPNQRSFSLLPHTLAVKATGKLFERPKLTPPG